MKPVKVVRWADQKGHDQLRLTHQKGHVKDKTLLRSDDDLMFDPPPASEPIETSHLILVACLIAFYVWLGG